MTTRKNADSENLREMLVNESFGYDPIVAAVNATLMLATEDGGSWHLEVKRSQVAAFLAEHTGASEADALTAIENAVSDEFLVDEGGGWIRLPSEEGR